MWQPAALTILVACSAPLPPVSHAVYDPVTPVVTTTELPRVIEIPPRSTVDVRRPPVDGGASLAIIGIAADSTDPTLVDAASRIDTAFRDRARLAPSIFASIEDAHDDVPTLERATACTGLSGRCGQAFATRVPTTHLVWGYVRLDPRGRPSRVDVMIYDVAAASVRFGSALVDRDPVMTADHAWASASKPAPRLAITANVPDAQLFVDGRMWAKVVNGRLDLRSMLGGSHTLRLDSPGMQSAEVTLAIEPGETILEYWLVPE